MSQPRTRQQLYDMIRESSRDEVILEEMIRLGFLEDNGRPDNPAAEVRRIGELERELRELATENRRLHDLERMKRDLRKQRMRESKQRQQETRERHQRERVDRAAAWNARKQKEILYLGPGVSGGLHATPAGAADSGKLASHSLTDFNAASLAAAMGISVGDLRFLAYARRTSKVTHYKRFQLRKKSGGMRMISAPMPRLKRAQRWILENILNQIPLHNAAHGFRPGRSIVTNAQPHVGSAVVVNVDLKDFFPSVTYPRVKGAFGSMGFSEPVCVILALLCTEPQVDQVKLDGRRYYVARSQRFLPQGSPASPAITNIICRGFDARLHANAEKLGFTYTRYADDITFSSRDRQADVGKALRRIRFIATSEGFEVHPQKTRVLRASRRQEVTGLVVNERLAVQRSLLRKFRAVLYQIEKDGPAGHRWGASPYIMRSLLGFANFVAMVDATKGKPLQQRVGALIEKHGMGDLVPARQRWQSPEPPVRSASLDPREVQQSGGQPTNDSEESKKPWWRIW